MTRKLFRSLLLPLLLLASVGVAQAQVAISPPIYDISLDGPLQTHAFRLINYGKQAKHVRVVVANWTMDLDGKVHVIAPTEQSLQPWLQVNPVEFTLAPGATQVVRFAARPAVRLKPGEHRAMIFFDEARDHQHKKAKPALRAYFDLGAAIYGHVGPVHRVGQVEKTAASATAATFRVHNTGNATVRFRGRYALWHASVFPGAKAAVPVALLGEHYQAPSGMLDHGSLPLDATLPGATRIVSLRFREGKALPPGRYVLSMRGRLGATDVNRDLRFRVVKRH